MTPKGRRLVLLYLGFQASIYVQTEGASCLNPMGRLSWVFRGVKEWEDCSTPPPKILPMLPAYVLPFIHESVVVSE